MLDTRNTMYASSRHVHVPVPVALTGAASLVAGNLLATTKIQRAGHFCTGIFTIFPGCFWELLDSGASWARMLIPSAKSSLQLET